MIALGFGLALRTLGGRLRRLRVDPGLALRLLGGDLRGLGVTLGLVALGFGRLLLVGLFLLPVGLVELLLLLCAQRLGRGVGILRAVEHVLFAGVERRGRGALGRSSLRSHHDDWRRRRVQDGRGGRRRVGRRDGRGRRRRDGRRRDDGGSRR